MQRAADRVLCLHIAGRLLARLRSAGAAVHCITNAVAQRFTANVLLAAGAIPSMTIAPDEIADFVARADALLVNLGTLDARPARGGRDCDRRGGASRRVPWVLDPVFVDRSPPRAAFARSLLAMPRRRCGSTPRSSQRSPAEAGRARRCGTTRASRTPSVALTGATDQVRTPRVSPRIANGDPLMDRVTAMGCAAPPLVGGAASRSSPIRWLAAAAGAARCSVSPARLRRNARAVPAVLQRRSSMRSTASTRETLMRARGTGDMPGWTLRLHTRLSIRNVSGGHDLADLARMLARRAARR